MNDWSHRDPDQMRFRSNWEKNDEPIDASIGYGLARIGRGIFWAGLFLSLSIWFFAIIKYG